MCLNNNNLIKSVLRLPNIREPYFNTLLNQHFKYTFFLLRQVNENLM